MRAFSSAAVVLSLQPDEMIREALDSVFGLGGELMGCGIINSYRGGHDLVSAAQEGTSLAEQRLRLLGCLRRQGGRAQVRRWPVCHCDSFPLSRCGGLCSAATSRWRPAITQVIGASLAMELSSALRTTPSSSASITL
jgi:hypothetical protein